MIEQPSRTLVCSIVFVDIVDYSTKPVAEQLLLKQAFNRLLSDRKPSIQIPQLGLAEFTANG